MDKNSTRSPRFIDANLVFPWYVEAFPEFSPYDVRFSMLDILSNLDNIHTADVRPVVRGHIEEDENTYLFCSECNCNITLAAYETPDNKLVLRPNFCPNCGADMREVGDVLAHLDWLKEEAAQ